MNKADTNTYTSHSGVIYTWLDFDNTKIYSPQEKRDIDLNNAEYLEAKHRDKISDEKLIAQKQTEQQSPLSEEQYYLENLRLDQERKKRQAEFEQIAVDAALVKTERRAALPKQVEIVENHLFSFIDELVYFASHQYVIVESSLRSNAATFFNVEMKKQAKPAK